METVQEIASLPDWLGTALIGAIIATITYVTKLIIGWNDERLEKQQKRRARLLELLSRLMAGRAIFLAQLSQVKLLVKSLKTRLPDEVEKYEGYEAIFSEMFEVMELKEKNRHSIIRSTTIHGMKPLNDTLLSWVQSDTIYKTNRTKSGLQCDLAQALHQLETHLLMWQAKYSAWIPEHPNHALVYLADESKHGPAFPNKIDEIVEKSLGGMKID